MIDKDGTPGTQENRTKARGTFHASSTVRVSAWRVTTGLEFRFEKVANFLKRFRRGGFESENQCRLRIRCADQTPPFWKLDADAIDGDEFSNRQVWIGRLTVGGEAVETIFHGFD